MPNGHYHAQCRNCASYTSRKRGRRCKRHDFIMPHVDEVICRDWSLRTQAAHDAPWAWDFVPALMESEGFRALEPGVLYHYHYFAAAPPEPLGSFAELQRLVWGIRIHHDDDLGWALYPSEPEYRLLPPPGRHLTLRLDGVDYPFDVTDEPRQRVDGGHRAASGAWESASATTMQRIIYSSTAPAALHTWLAGRLDLEAYRTMVDAHEFKDQVRDAGIAAFMAATAEPTVYTLRQIDGLLYGPYRHTPQRRDQEAPGASG